MHVADKSNGSYTMKNKSYIFTIALIVLAGCGSENEHDDDFIPYDIKAFNVWVYNNETDKEYFAGSVETDYTHAHDRLSNAQALAYNYATKRHLEDWSYVCGTVTSSSSCATKVK